MNVTNFSPALGSRLAAGASFSFDVTGATGLYAISITFPGSSELVWDGATFIAPYASTTRTAISGGYRYTVRHNGDWPDTPMLASVVEYNANSPMLADVSTLLSPIVLVGYRRIVVDDSVLSSDGRLVLANAASGHELDATLIIEIPEGIVTALGDDALVRPDDWNVDGWDTYDPDKGYSIFVVCTDATPGAQKFRSSAQIEKVRDTTAPSIVSLTVEAGDADKLIVAFDEPMFLPSEALTGLSIDVDTGAAMTLGVLVSGNGTDTFTFDLSRDVVSGDVINLVIASGRLLQDLDGNLIAAGSHTIDTSALDEYSMPGELHLWRGDSMTTTGSDVDTVVDQIGSLDLVASATNPTTTTINGEPAFQIIAGSYLKVDAGSSEDLSTFAILIVAAFPTNTATYEVLVALGRASDLVTTLQEIYWYPAFTITGRRDNAGGVGDTTTPSSDFPHDTTQHAILFTGDPNGAKIYLDGIEVGSSATSFTASATKRYCVGIAADLSTSPATAMKCAEVRIGASLVAGSNLTAAFDYCQAKYATP